MISEKEIDPIEEFRSQPALTKEWQETVSKDITQKVFACMKAKGETIIVPDDAEAIVSARVLARLQGRNEAISEFILLAFPLPSEQKQQLASFGIDATPEELAAAYGLQPS